MKYLVVINPEQEREFQQLLKTWQQLGAIQSFEPLPEDQHPDFAGKDKPGSQTHRRNDDPGASDWISQYADLLD